MILRQENLVISGRHSIDPQFLYRRSSAFKPKELPQRFRAITCRLPRRAICCFTEHRDGATVVIAV